MAFCSYLDASIDEVIVRLPRLFDGRLCLVTWLDSGTAPLPRLGSALDGRVAPVGSFGLVEGSDLIGKELFDGFDELLLFERTSRESISRIRWTAHYTSDRATFDAVPTTFVDAFAASGAVLYLADGVGLNAAATCGPDADALAATFRPMPRAEP